jgi:hypothetical protein
MSGATFNQSYIIHFCHMNNLPLDEFGIYSLAKERYDLIKSFDAPQNTMEGVALQPATEQSKQAAN